MKLICTSYTKQSGKINYYVTKCRYYGIMIMQERGILKTVKRRKFSKNFEETKEFVKKLQKGKVTAASLNSLCEDYMFSRKIKP